MAIIYLSYTSRQYPSGPRDERLICPVCPKEPRISILGKNGTYWRHILDARGLRRWHVQRYRCATCRTTFSALPYDLRPYTAATWALTWAIWVWHQEQQRAWSIIFAWLTQHGIPLHLRTLQRWQTRWAWGLPRIRQTIVQWIAALWGTRAIAVWDTGTGMHPWYILWRRIVAYAATHQGKDWRTGGLLGFSVLQAWLPITFFAGEP